MSPHQLIVKYEVWEAAEPRVKAMSAARQLKELIRSGCEVFVGYPGEVELWLETTRVYPNLGGCNKWTRTQLAEKSHGRNQPDAVMKEASGRGTVLR